MRTRFSLKGSAAPCLMATVLVGTLAPTELHAQQSSRFEVTGGVTRLTATETLDGAGPGWMLGAAWNATSRLGVAVEVSRSSRSERIGFLESEEDALALLGGPRLSWSVGVVRPFARMLVGATRLDLRARSESPIVSRATFDETHPTILMGGGVDYPLGLRWAARVGYDYRRILAPEAFGQHWLSVAAVVKAF